MSKISRVINGIALQQGLTKGSIQSDTLISELLNIGSLTTSSVQNLNPDALKQLVVDIQELPSKLGTNPDIERIETRFLIYDHILELLKGIGVELKVDKQQEYQKAVDELKVLTYEQNELIEAVRRLKSFLVRLNTLKSDQKTDKGETKLALVSCSMAFTDLVSMNGYNTTLLKKEVLADGDKMFGPLKRIHEAIEEFIVEEKNTTYMLNDIPIIEKIGANLELLSSLAKRSHSSSPAFALLYQMFVSSHHLFGNRELALTSGFPNGFTELDSISADLKDSWVESVVDGQSEALAEALNPLESFKKGFETIKDSLLIDDNDSGFLSSVIDEIVKLSPLNDVLDPLVKSIANVRTKSSLMDMAPTNRVEFNKLFVDVLKLSKHMNALKKVVGVVGILKEDEEKHMANILGFIANPTPNTAFAQLDTLRKSPAFKYVLDLVRDVEESIAVLTPDGSGTNPPKVTELAKTISPNFKQLAPYLKDLKTFLTNFKELRKVPGIEKLGNAVSTIQNIRKSTFSAGSFDNVASKLVDVKTSLTSLQNSISGMKGTNKDSKVLVDLTDLLKDSQTVGSATRVFRSMEMMPESRAVVLDKSITGLIRNKMKEMDSDDQKTLKQMLDLDSQLTAVYGQVDGVKKAVTLPTSDLSSLHSIFKLAETAPGTPINFLDILTSVQKLSLDPTLIKKDRDSLLEIQKKLKTLDSIGLDFARHHSAIGESKKALEQLDVFFSSYKTKITAIPATPGQKSPGKPAVPPSGGQSNSNSPSGATGGEETTTDGRSRIGEYWDSNKAWIIAVIVVSILFALAFLIFFCYRRRKGGKGKNRKPTSRLASRRTRKEEKEMQVLLARPVETLSKKEAELVLDETQKSWKIVVAQIDAAICTVLITDLYPKFILCYKNYTKFTGMKYHYNGILLGINESTKILVEKGSGADWQRYKTPLHHKNQLKLKDDKMFKDGEKPVLHANIFKLKNGFEMCMMEGPQGVNMTAKDGSKVGMIIPFWLAAIENRCEFVVMWEKFGGDNSYFPMVKGTIDYGEHLKATCEDVIEHTEKQYTVRRLTANYTGKESVTLEHISFNGWPDDGAVPKVTDGILEIIGKIQCSKSLVIMHCITGTGPSAVVALAMLNRERLTDAKGRLVPIETLPELRQVRANAIDTENEFLLANCLTFRLIYQAVDKKQLKKEVLEWGETIDSGFTNALSEADAQVKEELKKAAEDDAKKLKAWAHLGENAEPPKETPLDPAAEAAKCEEIARGLEIDIDVLDRNIQALNNKKIELQKKIKQFPLPEIDDKKDVKKGDEKKKEKSIEQEERKVDTEGFTIE